MGFSLPSMEVDCFKNSLTMAVGSYFLTKKSVLVVVATGLGLSTKATMSFKLYICELKLLGKMCL